MIQAQKVRNKARKSSVEALSLTVRITNEFREDVWDPLAQQLKGNSVTQILKEAIVTRAGLEIPDSEVFIRLPDGTTELYKKFLGIT